MVSTDASPLAEDRDQYREEKYGENVERASPCGDEREIRKLNERKRTVNAFSISTRGLQESDAKVSM